MWPSAHGNGERYSVDSIMWQKDFVILEVPPSCQDTNPWSPQFCESRNKFSLLSTTQKKAVIHPGVKTTLGTVMAASFLGSTTFQQSLQYTPKLSGVSDVQETTREVKGTEERCSDTETWAQKESTRNKLYLSSMDLNFFFKIQSDLMKAAFHLPYSLQPV